MKQVLRLRDNIFVAIGYGLANCVMIEGEDGLIIIDVMESPDTARDVLAEFRRITNKPIRGIILTHFHFDHINGLEVFMEDVSEKDKLEVRRRRRRRSQTGHCTELSDAAGDHTRELPASPAADQEREVQRDLHEGGQAVRDRDPGGDQQPNQGQVIHPSLSTRISVKLR